MRDAKCRQAILLVEDSPEDCEATVRALRSAGLANPIVHCADGDDALDFLRRRGRYAAYAATMTPRPGLVLLDINLPGTDGREVLAEIKADASLQLIPVIMLTSSSDPRDVDACYRAGANSYMTKPVGLQGLMDAVQHLKDYWFEIAVWPQDPTLETATPSVE